RVPLTWTDGHGVEVTKTYVFRRGQYAIGVEYDVRNRSQESWQASPYAQIERSDPPTQRTYFNVESYSFHGPAIRAGLKYRKLKIDNAEDAKFDIKVMNGWIAALQHHFVGAVVPPPDTPYRFTLSVQGIRYLLAAVGPMVQVAPGQSV